MQPEGELQELLRLLHLRRDDILALSEALDALDAADLLPTRLFPLRQRLTSLIQCETQPSTIYPTPSRSASPVAMARSVYPLPSPSIQANQSNQDDGIGVHRNLPGHVAGGAGAAPVPDRRLDDCHRGAVGPKKKARKGKAKGWKVGEAPHVPVTDTVQSFVAQLAAARWGSETYDVATWVAEVADVLKDCSIVFQDESLTSLVGRCTDLRSLGLRVSFLTMLNQIQLVAKCTR